jgi:hypothetical protein
MRRTEQRYELRPGAVLWLFQAGFLVDREPDLRAELAQYGCAGPRNFGQNIFLCQLTMTRSTYPASMK